MKCTTSRKYKLHFYNSTPIKMCVSSDKARHPKNNFPSLHHQWHEKASPWSLPHVTYSHTCGIYLAVETTQYSSTSEY
jgi:hypothetical protein